MPEAANREKGIGPGSSGSCCGRPAAHPISRSLGGGRPHGYQLSGVGGTRNEEGSAPPMAPYSLRALWTQEVGATHLWEQSKSPLLKALPPGGLSVPQSLGVIPPDWTHTYVPPSLGLPAALPTAARPLHPGCGPHLVYEAGSALDLAQPKQGKEEPSSSAQCTQSLLPQPSSRKLMGTARQEEPLKTWPAPPPLLWWSLQNILSVPRVPGSQSSF